MSEEPLYMIRDPSGAIYGPGNIATLRQWITEGRITSQMLIAPQGTQDFVPASQLPELVTAFSAPATANQTYPTATAAQGYTANAYAPYPSKSSGLAIASLVCSLASLVLCWLGIPVAIVGVVLGHIARGQIRREPDRYDGMGMATAGTIIGYCIVGILCLIIFFVILAAVFDSSPR